MKSCPAGPGDLSRVAGCSPGIRSRRHNREVETNLLACYSLLVESPCSENMVLMVLMAQAPTSNGTLGCKGRARYPRALLVF